jgi:ABC-2 type transport system ATP-binding protein
MNALDIAQISHAYGTRQALEAVSFSVEAQKFAVLLGLNGAGKTSLLSLITRLQAPQHGSIAVFGKDVHSDPLAVLAMMGIVFQPLTLDLDLTVRENLRYHGALHGLGRREIEERQAEELARMGLRERLDNRVRALSGGLRRRVELARALLHRPRLLLLDEPTVGLDPTARKEILAHTRALCRERHATAFWATHLLDEVEPDDDVVLLHRGRVLRTGKAQEIAAADGSGSLAEAFTSLTSAD